MLANLADCNAYNYLNELVKLLHTRPVTAYKACFTKFLDGLQKSGKVSAQTIHQLSALRKEVLTEQQCYSEFLPALEAFMEEYAHNLQMVSAASGVDYSQCHV